VFLVLYDLKRRDKIKVCPLLVSPVGDVRRRKAGGSEASLLAGAVFLRAYGTGCVARLILGSPHSAPPPTFAHLESLRPCASKQACLCLRRVPSAPGARSWIRVPSSLI